MEPGRQPRPGASGALLTAAGPGPADGRVLLSEYWRVFWRGVQSPEWLNPGPSAAQLSSAPVLRPETGTVQGLRSQRGDLVMGPSPSRSPQSGGGDPTNPEVTMSVVGSTRGGVQTAVEARPGRSSNLGT